MLMEKDQVDQMKEQTLENWGWLTEGIEDEQAKVNTSMVLQNSYEQMVSNGDLHRGWLEERLNEFSGEMLTEAPQVSSSVGNIVPKVIFPIIRRVMPKLIANEIVSVQPVTGRTGIIYHILYQYSDEKGGIDANDEYSGIARTASAGPGFATYYSSEKIGPKTGTIAADASDDTTITFGTDASNFLGTSATGDTDARKKIKAIEVYKSTGEAYNGVVYDSTKSAFGATEPHNVIYAPSTGIVSLRDVGDTGVGVPPWKDDAGDTVTVFIVYDQEGSSDIPEMEFSIGSQNVETVERKMKVRWTKESEQDMRAYHKLDVESELVRVASMEMNYEIDRELLRFIGSVVPSQHSFTHDWAADAATSGNNTAGNYLDRHRAFAQRIYLVGARIGQNNRQGPATWAVVSPQVGATFASLPNFTVSQNTGKDLKVPMNYGLGGYLANGVKVYVDPNRISTTNAEVLLGYKPPNSTYGAGVVYSPYTSWMTNVVTHPDNFNSIRGFFSRYAITEVERGKWNYGKITVSNLEFSGS